MHAQPGPGRGLMYSDSTLGNSASSWGYIVVRYNTGYVTGTTGYFDQNRDWSGASPTWPEGRAYRNPLREHAMVDRKFPCALATPPGPPPVDIDDAAGDVLGSTTPDAEPWRPERRPRLHARSAVPARTRRRLRTWERHAATQLRITATKDVGK